MTRVYSPPQPPGPPSPPPRPFWDWERFRPLLTRIHDYALVRRSFAASIAIICIVSWILLFGLGSVLDSSQLRFLLNLGSIRTVFDPPTTAPKPQARADTKIQAAADAVPLSTTGTSEQPAILDASGMLGQPAVETRMGDLAQLPTGPRSWSDLGQARYQIPEAAGGTSPPFNPDRVELVLRNFLGRQPSTLELLLLALATYTPTNLMFLACLSGLAGSACLIVGCSLPTDEFGNYILHPGAPTCPLPFLRTLTRGLATGFVSYLVIAAGLLVVTGTPFQLKSPDDYTRLSASMSLAGFVLAFRPRLFLSVVQNLNQVAADPKGKAQA